MLKSLFKSLFKRKSSHEAFWDWFVKHEKHYYWMDKPMNDLFRALDKQLSKVNPHLTFEFSVEIQADKREFVISAEGILDGFPDVIQLVETAPDLDKWKITAFRQASGETEVYFNTVHLNVENVFFAYRLDSLPDEKLDIALFAYNYVDNMDWNSALFLILDGLLGEYDVRTQLGVIDTYRYEPKLEGQVLPITELPRVLETYFPKH